MLQLGKDEQPYPIPIVRKGARWRFDPSEGHEDLLSRRMSKTELSTLDVVLAYVEAQRAYHQEPRRGDDSREYAQKIRSSPGRHDGLVWEGQPGKTAGPLAGLVEVAGREGYGGVRAAELPIYRGYAYSILTAQGPRAPGGARDYLVNGRMTEGKDEPMDTLNKGLFTFASYNAGPGRLQQLRKLAAKRGLDPNVWFNNVELIAAEKLGRETV